MLLEALIDFFSNAIVVGVSVGLVGLAAATIIIIVGEKRGWWG